MAVVDQEPNELEKLLADVQRTIRENAVFINSLKKEAVESAAAAVSDEEADDGNMVAEEEYEEL
jgi:hypothetical protein